MTRHQKNNNAFTLLEIMMVVIILGVLVALAFPNFTKALQGGYETAAITQLRAIKSAENTYYASEKQYYPGGLGSTAAINTNLKLDIIENNVTYSCTSGGSSFSCTATFSGSPAWGVTISDSSDPACTNSNCPHCTPAGCPY